MSCFDKDKKVVWFLKRKKKIIDKQCDKLSKFLKKKMKIRKNPSILRCQLDSWFIMFFISTIVLCFHFQQEPKLGFDLTFLLKQIDEDLHWEICWLCQLLDF